MATNTNRSPDLERTLAEIRELIRTAPAEVVERMGADLERMAGRHRLGKRMRARTRARAGALPSWGLKPMQNRGMTGTGDGMTGAG